MLNNLISVSKIEEAYNNQIQALVNVASAEQSLAEAKVHLQRVFSNIPSQFPDFKLGKNDLERSMQMEEYCGPESKNVNVAQEKVDQCRSLYQQTAMEIDKLKTIIRYIEAIKDIPEGSALV